MNDIDKPLGQEAPEASKPKQGGFFSNLLFNIILPVVIMSKLSGEDMLGPLYSIVVALAFPIGYGIWEMRLTSKVNVFSVLGVVSVLLTGGISLLQLDPKYIAIKEAAIPGLIGLAVIISQKSHKSVVRLILFNEQIFRLDRIEASLAEHNNESAFEKKMSVVSYLVASSFFVSSILNYVLAKVILQSPPGTTEFTEELGKMTAWSYPVIVIPSMIVLGFAMWYLFAQLRKLTHLPLDDLMIDQSKK